MASVVLTLAGSAIGNSLLPGIGGALLGGLGGALGSTIDHLVFGASATAKGPRLDTLRVQDSAYGNGLPIIYGRTRLAGNVIWVSDLHETLTQESSGGKGGGGGSTTVERASYSVDVAIAIGEGPLGNLLTIWADGKQVYTGGIWNNGVIGNFEYYTGTSSQSASPIMEAALGSGYVPAYRGLSYVVIEGLQLGNFGNRLPNFTFEVSPYPSTPTPVWLGDTDPSLYGRPDSFGFPSALAPIALQSRGTTVSRVLIGGIDISSGEYRFCAVEYDITGDLPVEMTRTYSSWVARTGATQDLSWALSPDKRHVVFYMQHDEATHPVALALYDTQARSFGAVLEDNLGSTTAHVQVFWLDQQHIVLPDVQSSAQGLRIYIAAGASLVYSGFTNVWGAGSSVTRFLISFSQFARVSGGLVMLAGDSSTTPTHFYARSLSWNNGVLTVGSESAFSTGVSSFAGAGAALLSLGHNEFVLARWSFSQIRLMSFTCDLNSISVTRNWTTIALSPSGNISVNVYNGGLVFQHQPFGSPYGYGEIALTSSGFSLSQPTVLISGTYLYSADALSVYPVDSERFLLQAGASGDVFALVALFRRNENTTTLSAVVSDILARAGYESGDYDVSALSATAIDGYVLSDPMAARKALEPLQAFASFDLIETDGVLVAKPYSSLVDVEIERDESRASASVQQIPPAQIITRAQEQDLPACVSVDYLDPVLDYQKGSQSAQRMTSAALSTSQIRLPLVCSASRAKQVAQVQLYRSWVERANYELPIARGYAHLDPGDVFMFDGQNLRIRECQLSGGIIKIKATPVSSMAVGSAASADAGTGVSRPRATVSDTVLYLMDLPLLRASDDQPGIYIAATGGGGWTGAALFRSSDGVNFSRVISLRLPASAGVAASILGDAPTDYMDRTNTIRVALISGSLSSVSEPDLLNGANVALLGAEIIQYQNAALNTDGSYTLSNLLRGRKGTQTATSDHVLGEDFVLLQSDTIQFLPLNSSDRGNRITYRGISTGQSVDDGANKDITYQLHTLQPLAPVHIHGVRNTSGDLTLSWVRCARKNAEWLDGVDVPLDEAQEMYDVEIMNGSIVARTYASHTAAGLTYSASEQIADFGSVQPSLSVKIYQLSALYGRGLCARATV